MKKEGHVTIRLTSFESFFSLSVSRVCFFSFRKRGYFFFWKIVRIQTRVRVFWKKCFSQLQLSRRLKSVPYKNPLKLTRYRLHFLNSLSFNSDVQGSIKSCSKFQRSQPRAVEHFRLQLRARFLVDPARWARKHCREREASVEHCRNSSSKGHLFGNHSNFLRSPDPFLSLLPLHVRCSETGDRKIWNVEMPIMDPAKLGGKRRAAYATGSIPPPPPFSNWNQSHELTVGLLLSLFFLLSFSSCRLQKIRARIAEALARNALRLHFRVAKQRLSGVEPWILLRSLCCFLASKHSQG